MKVFCFGELLLRLSPGEQWIREMNMPACIGGAELNVATALARWNIPVKYMTVLPDNFLSHNIETALKDRGIDTSAIKYGGDRIGIYYLPQDADLKHAGVIYDREHSAFASLQKGMINWDEVLNDCDWFHFSAISPALNNNVAEVCREALEVASSKKMRISVDLNYRSKLWQYGQKPSDIMPALISYCDVIMGNLWAVESLLSISSPVKASTGKSSADLVEAATVSIKSLHETYPRATTIAYTFRLDKKYFGILWKNEEITTSEEFSLHDVVDKVGSGDCFMAGLIYGLLGQQTNEEMINFSAAAAVGKMKEKGDSTRQTVEIINTMMKNNG